MPKIVERPCSACGNGLAVPGLTACVGNHETATWTCTVCDSTVWACETDTSAPCRS